jgi:predicted Zn finger-like uncharacterized protein
MATISIRCPECRAALKFDSTPAPGKKIKCPRCNEVFVPETDEDAPLATAVQSSPGKSRASRREEDEERPRRRKADRDDEEHPRAGKLKKSGSGGLLLVIGVVCVGVLMLACGGVGLAAWLILTPAATRNPSIAQGGPADAAHVEVNPGPGKPVVPVVKGVPAAGELNNDLRQKVGRATAHIMVEGTNFRATGSGFLVKVNGDTAYLITNEHVVAAPDEPEPEKNPPPRRFGPPGFRAPRFGPPGFGQPAAQPKTPPRISVVLHSGTPQEQSFKADLVAFDEDADLAALRITGARNLPEALDVSVEPPLAETMPVYIFGFPADKAPAVGSPTVNLGKGSVSQVRRDAANKVIDVQVNGELNPGNSGGPVVDALGRLVGIAVSTVRNKNVGFAVPTAKLLQMFQGRLQATLLCHVTQTGRTGHLNGEVWILDQGQVVRKRQPLTLNIPVDPRAVRLAPGDFNAWVRLCDPMAKVSTVTAYFKAADSVPKEPTPKGWAPLPGTTSVNLNIQDQNAIGTFQLPPGTVADQFFAFQFSYVNADGQTIYTQPNLARLTFPKNLQSVTLNITGIPDEPTQRYAEELVLKAFPGMGATVKSRTPTSLVVELDSVADLKVIAPAITFGKVGPPQGRTFDVTLNKLDLPTPDPADVAKWIEDLKSTDGRRKTTACDLLGKAYAPLPERRAEVAKLLADQIPDKEFWLRKAAVHALQVWATREEIPRVAKALESPDVFTRGEAFGVLRKFPDPSTAPAIAERLVDLGDRGNASAALKAIGPAAQKAVFPFTNHKDGFVASEACNILKEIGNADSVPILTPLTSSPNFMIANSAKAALQAVQARK